MITVRAMTNRTRGFYTLMGPYLARREIVKELGGHLWDDDDKTWFVATNGSQVLGFCAARPGVRGVTVFQSSYVLPAHRRRGVYRAIMQARDEAFPGPAQATCTAASLPVHLQRGFEVAGTRGSFTRVTRP